MIDILDRTRRSLLNVGDSIQQLGNLSIYLNNTSIDPAITTDNVQIASWNDLSPNTKIGTKAGNIALHLQGGEREVEFEGGGYFNYGQDSDFDVVSNFTMIARVGATLKTNGTILSKAGSATSDRQYTMYTSGGNLLYFIGGTNVNTGSAVSVGSLIIITVGATTTNAWIDGTQVITNAAIGTNTVVQDFNVGARTNGSYLWDGNSNLDLIALARTEATQVQVDAIEAEFKIN